MHVNVLNVMCLTSQLAMICFFHIFRKKKTVCTVQLYYVTSLHSHIFIFFQVTDSIAVQPPTSRIVE